MKNHTVIEINKDALAANLAMFRSVIPRSTRLAAVVKSNAYGHGMTETAGIALDAGADVLAVNSAPEALLLAGQFPQAKILVMGVVPSSFFSSFNHERFSLMVSDVEIMAGISRQSPRAGIHLKVDTGMGRLGIAPEDAARTAEQIKKDGINLTGIATHFASTEDFTEHSYSMRQLTLFREAVDSVKSSGFGQLTAHCAASASAMLFPEAHMDMVRIGIAMYGLWPSEQTRLSLKILGREFSLKPALSWKTRIIHINNLPAGAYVGYGSTYKTTAPAKVAVLPVGYYEGLDRKMSNSGYIITGGQRARIIGRVCMNMTMADVTHISGVKAGDEVTLIGCSGQEEITADEIAGITGTINYETVTRINSELPRIITGD